jgi:hypothetical protein
MSKIVGQEVAEGGKGGRGKHALLFGHFFKNKSLEPPIRREYGHQPVKAEMDHP